MLAAWIALAAVALLDIAIAPLSSKGIVIDLPKVLRGAVNRPLRLDVHITNQTRHARLVRLALPLPASFSKDAEWDSISLPADVEASRAALSVVPRKRGRFVLSRAVIETSSILGLWHMRRAHPLESEIRVYPNLFADKKTLAALLASRSGVGVHTLRQLGKGREFEKLREYVPGDGYDEIHWKATARRRRPITKVYQIERSQDIYIAVDISRLSARLLGSGLGSGEGVTTTLDSYITAALVLAQAAEGQGDRFGLLAFSNQVHRFVPAGNGKAHYAACRDALFSLQPHALSPDFSEVASFLRLRVRRRALVIFLTALDDPILGEGFVRGADLLRRQHLLFAAMIQPQGVVPVFTSPVENPDDLYVQLGGHMLWNDLRELQKLLQSRGVPFHLLEKDRYSADLVNHYIAVKQAQAL